METRTMERRGFLLALAGAGVAMTSLGTVLGSGAAQAAPLATGPAPAAGLDDIRAALAPEGAEEMQRRRGPPHRRLRRRFGPPPRRPRVRCWVDRFGRRVCRRVW